MAAVRHDGVEGHPHPGDPAHQARGRRGRPCHGAGAGALLQQAAAQFSRQRYSGRKGVRLNPYVCKVINFDLIMLSIPHVRIKRFIIR